LETQGQEETERRSIFTSAAKKQRGCGAAPVTVISHLLHFNGSAARHSPDDSVGPPLAYNRVHAEDSNLRLKKGNALGEELLAMAFTFPLVSSVYAFDRAIWQGRHAMPILLMSLLFTGTTGLDIPNALHHAHKPPFVWHAGDPGDSCVCFQSNECCHSVVLPVLPPYATFKILLLLLLIV